MDSARPVFVALADAEALAGAEDADALAGAELLFAVDAEYCGEAVRGAYTDIAPPMSRPTTPAATRGIAPLGLFAGSALTAR